MLTHISGKNGLKACVLVRIHAIMEWVKLFSDIPCLGNDGLWIAL
jgi:hypothetical protein